MTPFKELLLKLKKNSIKIYLKGQGELQIKGEKEKLTSELVSEIKANKLELINFLKERESNNYLTSIPVSERNKELYPASFSQNRLWLIDRLGKSDASYNIPSRLKLEGKLDVVAFKDTLNSLVQRHEILRTVFVEGERGPLQKVIEEQEFSLKFVDALSHDIKAQQELSEKYAQEQSSLNFNLASGPLIQGTLIQYSTHSYELFLTMHHIISDGWSMSVFIDEFIKIYSAYSQSKNNPLPPLAIQYIDYSIWQQNQFTAPKMESQLNYWRNQLDNAPALLELPTDFSRPAVKSNIGESFRVSIDRDTTRGIEALAKKHGATVHMILMAAWGVLMSRLSGHNDIVIGTPIANRNSSELETLIGFFVNTLALRVNIEGEKSVDNLIENVRQVNLDAYANKDVPFEQVIEACNPERGLGYTPLFQTMLVYQNTPSQSLSLPGLSIKQLELPQTTAKFDLTLALGIDNGELTGLIEFASDLFEKQTIARWMEYFKNILSAISNNSAIEVKDIVILDDKEYQYLNESFNASPSLSPKHSNIVQHFSEVVASKPEANALYQDGISYSFQELNCRTNKLANYLQYLGIREKEIVVTCLPRGIDLIVAQLAILKIGATFLPVDPALPIERKKFIVEDSKASKVIINSVDESFTESLILNVNEVKSVIEKYSYADPNVNIEGESSAYVIYTSGSTGTPKGVMVSHKNVLCRLATDEDLVKLEPGDVIGLINNPAFDVSIWEIYGSLLKGASIVTIPENYISHPEETVDLMLNRGVNCLALPSAVFNKLLTVFSPVFGKLKYLLIGGESLDKQSISTVLKDSPPSFLINSYGPTETTFAATGHIINKKDLYKANIPIGKPLANTEVYILDQWLRPLPLGVIGEICIGGSGVAKGYLNRQDLTDKKFINCSFKEREVLLYRTGDLGRYLPDGTVEFIGRSDSQVKIRGFRIELGEIENTIKQNELVHDAVVVVDESTSIEKRLLAYVVETKETDFELESLKMFLRDKLPEHMIPSNFIVLAGLPLTPNGKVDKKALPKPRVSTIDCIGKQAPCGEIESKIAEIWKNLLGVETVYRQDNFFELGGHSLLILQMLSQFEKANLYCKASDIFSAQSLMSLAKLIANNKENAFEVPTNLITLDSREITPEMLPLVSLSQPDIDKVISQVPKGVSNIQDIYPLLPLQEGVLLMHMMHEDNDPYVMSALMDMKSEKALDSLINGLQYIIERHDVLRTAVIWQELESPVQVVCREAKLPIHKLAIPDSCDAHAYMSKILSGKEGRISLSQAPLMTLFIGERQSSDRFVVALKFHHIVSDHIGLEIIQKELYACFTAKQADLNKPVQYRDFVAFALNMENDTEAEHFFKKHLEGIDESTFPFGLNDVQGNGLNINEISQDLNLDLSNNIRELSKRFKISPAVLFHAAWALVVSVCSGRKDIVFGSVVSGRMNNMLGAGDSMGMFINTLPIRVNLQDISIQELIEDIKDTLASLIPFEQTALSIAQGYSELPASTPLFSAILNYRHSSEPKTKNIDLDKYLTVVEAKERTNYPFNLNVDDLSSGFSLNLQIDSRVNVHRVMDYVQTALLSIVNHLQLDSKKDVSILSALPDSEKARIKNWNRGTIDNSVVQCIHLWVEQQVNRTPHNIALEFGGAGITYQELNNRANQLAHYLTEHYNVGPEVLVGVCLERSFDMVVCILAILKAGGAYVAMDPSYPKARLEYISEHSNLSLILTQSDINILSSNKGIPSLSIDNCKLKEQLSHYSESNIDPREIGLTANNLAYVIYTSGSTGNPKGVMIEHASVSSLITWVDSHYSQEELSRTLCSTSICFDLFAFETWAVLACGGCSVIVENILGLLEEEELSPTLINTVPSAMKAILEAKKLPRSARTINLAGEPLKKGLVNDIFSTGSVTQVNNLYGPSEDTTYSSFAAFQSKLDVEPSIGKPIYNTDFYVLDDKLSLVPIGVKGELYIGGSGLARGYLNSPELTQNSFIKNPFYDHNDPASSERLYKTGDMVKYLEDGSLSFNGRVDHQVKIRGFRIELEDIEQTLRQSSQVEDVLLIASNSNVDESQLLAYVILHRNESELAPDEKNRLVTDELNTILLESLPAYMHPSHFIFLDEWPLLPNGKINRKELPQYTSYEVEQNFQLPKTKIEKELVNIWQDVLNKDSVGVMDNFFDLGGHSLLVVQIIARMQAKGVRIAVAQFFSSPTIFEQAKLLSSGLNIEKVFHAPENLIPANSDHITPEMLPLISLSQKEIDFIVKNIPGGATNIQDIYPLAPLQEGVLFMHNMHEHTDPYILSAVIKVQSKAVLDVLIDGLQFVVDRHDVLRTAFFWEDIESPVQVVCKKAKLPVFWSQDNVSDELLQSTSESLSSSNDRLSLKRAPLIQLNITQCKFEETYSVKLMLHHIVSDHVGLEIIQKELHSCFLGTKNTLAEPVPYRDFVAYSLKKLNDNEGKAYFTSALTGIDQPTYPFELSDVQNNGLNLIGKVHTLSPQLSVYIREVAKEMEISPAVIFHAAWAMVVAACSGQDDIVFGTVMSGRLHNSAGADNSVGMFINTLPLRVNLHDLSCAELIKQLQESLFNLLQHEQFPLSMAQNCCELDSSTALFSAILNFRHSAVKASDKFDLKRYLSIEDAQERTNYPFNLNIDDFGDDFTLHLQIDNSVCVERVLNYVNNALNELVACLSLKPKSKIANISILSEEEKQEQLGGSKTDYAFNDKLQGLHRIFEKQANQTPDALAAICDDQQLTFSELNIKANQLAYYLFKEKNVLPNSLVGINLERSLDMVISIMAIWKLGAAYVPIDTSAPAERIKHIIVDTEMVCLITSNALIEGLPKFNNIEIIAIEQIFSLGNQLELQEIDNFEAQVQDEQNLAYVIYTSGTTGKPKGVMIGHDNLLSYIPSFKEQLDLLNVEQGTPWLMSHSFSFDASLKGLVALSLGQKIIIATEMQSKDPQEIVSLIQTHYVQVYNSTPHMMSYVIDELTQQSTCLPNLILSGEQTPTDVLNKVRDYCSRYKKSAVNAYGPTETTINCSYGLIEAEGDLHIGKTGLNAKGYVLSPSKNILPKGVTGELYIGGEGVAHGYINNRELNSELFINSPFNSNERIYRTGDLVKYLASGEMIYIGRVDEQVKIRGYRIDLLEIGHLISKMDGVLSSQVIVNKDESGDGSLVAYLLVDDLEIDENSFIQGIKSSLSAYLPEYMIPSAFIILNEWPLLKSGKIDKRSLPKPDNTRQQTVYIEPVTITEKTLTEIWGKLLNLTPERISTNANFFELGGNSLLAMRMIAEIKSRFKKEPKFKRIFSTPVLSELAIFIDQCSTKSNRPSITVQPREDIQYPLSFAQQRLLFIERYKGETSEYNMPMAYRFKGDLDLQIVERVICHIIARHEVLRTVYVDGEQGGYQVVRPGNNFKLWEKDLSHLCDEKKEKQLSTILANDAVKPFNLREDLMIRVGHAKLEQSEPEGVLVFNMHHIASDGWSMQVLLKEFFTLYESFTLGNSDSVPELTIQYIDYALWQRKWCSEVELKSQLNYWQSNLESAPVVHSLPLDYDRPRVKTYEGEEVSSEIPVNIAQGLKDLALEHKLTPFMLLHAALALVLSRHSNSHDIVIGSPVANRTQAELEPLIGYFTNTFALRVNTNHNYVSEYLKHVRQVNLNAQSNQDAPVEKVIEHLKIPRTEAYTPLFQIMLTTNTSYGIDLTSMDKGLPGIEFKPVLQTKTLSKFDLNINIHLKDGESRLLWTYDKSLFNKKTIERLNSRLLNVMNAFAEQAREPEISEYTMDSISMLSDEERDMQLTGIMPSQKVEQNVNYIHEIFERQARLTPDKPALKYLDSTLSFRELNEKSNQLANYLCNTVDEIEKQLIGICMPRSVDMVIAILATLKAGGAYVPLDPLAPKQRLSYILKDTNVATVLTTKHVAGHVNLDCDNVTCIDEESVEYDISSLNTENISLAHLNESFSHISYVIYTSGSTGQPKGVTVTHDNIISLANVMIDWPIARETDIVGWNASFVFDASLQGLVYLFQGKTLVILPNDVRSEPEMFKEFLETTPIDLLDCTPSMVNLWFQHGLQQALPSLIIGGEAITVELWKQLVEWQSLYSKKALNVYGPTECTVNSTVAEIQGDKPTIGVPLPYAGTLVLDSRMNLIPQGVVGELYIGGQGVASGYLNNPTLTSERFIRNPYFDSSSKNGCPLLYKTGDLVRENSEGQLEFIGRVDDQVKIRGYRVELAEIEQKLVSYSCVESAIVQLKETPSGENQLVAFIKKSSNSIELSTKSLLHFLSNYLPEHMLPRVFVLVEEWPLTINGKIDKKRLPSLSNALSLGEYKAPRTDTENELVTIWAELLLLEKSKISILSSFFELGGHSLLALQLIEKVNSRLDKVLQVKDVFKYSTIESLAEFIELENQVDESRKVECLEVELTNEIDL